MRKRKDLRREGKRNPTGRLSQRRKREETFVEKGNEKFSKVVLCPVLSFGYSKDMLEYPCREECGFFYKG
jgi:hypothetical protein